MIVGIAARILELFRWLLRADGAMAARLGAMAARLGVQAAGEERGVSGEAAGGR